MSDVITSELQKFRDIIAKLKHQATGLRKIAEDVEGWSRGLEDRTEKLSTKLEAYRKRVQREEGAKCRILQAELEAAKAEIESLRGKDKDSDLADEEFAIASTMAILEFILLHICRDAEDFRLISYATLFPMVYERVSRCDDPGYILDVLPPSTDVVIARGREYVKFIREVSPTHVTNPDSWDLLVGEVSRWWINDALPLIYGKRDPNWDTDVPLSLEEITLWRDDPSERALSFPTITDAYNIYRSNKDRVLSQTGILNYKPNNNAPQN